MSIGQKRIEEGVHNREIKDAVVRELKDLTALLYGKSMSAEAKTPEQTAKIYLRRIDDALKHARNGRYKGSHDDLKSKDLNTRSFAIDAVTAKRDSLAEKIK